MYSQVALNYSQALVELAKEQGNLDQILAEAEKLLPLVKMKEMEHFLKHPKVPIQNKREILLKIIPVEAPKMLANFLSLIVDRRRANFLPMIIESLVDLARQAKGYALVELISAQPLNETEQEGVRLRLEQTWQTKVFVKYRENPGLIGGIIIRRGDELIDGSLSGQIKALKHFLLQEIELPAVFS